MTVRFIICIALLAAGVSCKHAPPPVEIHQDTPQATIATLIKLYAAQDQSRLPQIVEPLITRMQARQDACVAAIVKSNECMQLIAEHLGSSWWQMPDSCKGSLDTKSCTCGPQGNAAASKAPDFLASDSNRALSDVAFSPERCSITDAQTLDSDGVATASAGFWEEACSEVPKTDSFASVSVSCGGGGDPFVFLLRKHPTGWFVVGLGGKTAVRLFQALAASQAATAAAQAAASASARTQELNKDLK